MNQRQSTTRPLIFGEVLFDHFPDGSKVLGGAPINVAWHLQAFGCGPMLVTRVGCDGQGDEIIDQLKGWGLDQSGLQVDKDHATGAVNIALSDAGDATFDIIDDRAFDYISSDIEYEPSSVRLVYHGSLALRHEASRTGLHELLQATHAPAFIDINLRDPWWSIDDVQHWARQARWMKINDDELKRLSPQKGVVENMAEALLKDYDLETLVVTQGAKGAFALTREGEWARIDVANRVDVVDTVGAGDAFASVLILGILLDWSLDDTLVRAQDFASAVVGLRGATTNDDAFYAPFIEKWAIV